MPRARGRAPPPDAAAPRHLNGHSTVVTLIQDLGGLGWLVVLTVMIFAMGCLEHRWRRCETAADPQSGPIDMAGHSLRCPD